MVAATDGECKTSSLKPKFKEDLSGFFFFFYVLVTGCGFASAKGEGCNRGTGGIARRQRKAQLPACLITSIHVVVHQNWGVQHPLGLAAREAATTDNTEWTVHCLKKSLKIVCNVINKSTTKVLCLTVCVREPTVTQKYCTGAQHHQTAENNIGLTAYNSHSVGE